MDVYCDTIAEAYKNHKKGGRQSILENQVMLNLEKMQAGDHGLQDFALYINLEWAKGRPFGFCMELLVTFYQEMGVHEDIMEIAGSCEDISRNWGQGGMPTLLAVEEGGACWGRTAFLRDFYRLGVRMMTLARNSPNGLASPNARITEEDGTFRMAPGAEHGSTDTGIVSAEKMERLGMIIDISYLNDVDIQDVSRHIRNPFVASHSSAGTMTSHPGNLVDDMIRVLTERGGVASINYYIAFLRDFGPREGQLSHISDMMEHMKHIRKIGGIGCIGLGPDSDGVNGNLEVGGTGRLPMLAHAVERESFTSLEIEVIFCKNVLQVYREVP